MKLYRRDREIHLLHLGRAHTEGDVFVYLPKEKVVITGDAVIGWTPFMGDGYPEDWAATRDPRRGQAARDRDARADLREAVLDLR
jgi:glyoxylase-like metal-dependent hydrolase (beta-lactamase superfamily II)